MTTFYLIRHGQSEANLHHVFLGHQNLDLTSQGRQQAEMAAAYLRDIPVDAIYSSDLIRAYHTAEPTAKAVGLPIRTDTALREIYAGLWENRPYSELLETYPEDYGLWLRDIGNSRCTGGESVAELQARFVSVLKRLADEWDNKTLFVFTHATPIRALKAACEGMGLEAVKDTPWPSNASVTKVICDGGELRLIFFSEDGFMGDLATHVPNTV